MKNLEVNKKLLQNLAKKGSSLVLVSSLLLATPNVLPTSNNYVYASSNEEIVNLNVQTGVNLYLNDKGFIPRDVNGNETYPFISEGTTYVPIRAIAELFNASVRWDASSNTVLIATSGESPKLTHTPRVRQELTNKSISASKGIKLIVNGKECIPKDAKGNIKDIYVVNGTTYVPVRAITEALCLPITWSDKTNSVFIGNHKSTDLTVENINDPEYFDKCGRDFIEYASEPLDRVYFYDGSSYLAVSEKYYAEYYPPTMALILFNQEYCSDELIKAMFDGISGYDFDRMLSFVKNFYNLIKKDRDYYQFDKYIINSETAYILNELQNRSIKKYKTNDATDLVNLACDYWDEKYSQDKETNGLIDYLMYRIAWDNYSSEEVLSGRFQDTEKYNNEYFYKMYCDASESYDTLIENIASKLTPMDKELTKE